ncbi:MAG: hypothetical protein R3A47_10120 [Polyangiales bacterium]
MRAAQLGAMLLCWTAVTSQAVDLRASSMAQRREALVAALAKFDSSSKEISGSLAQAKIALLRADERVARGDVLGAERMYAIADASIALVQSRQRRHIAVDAYHNALSAKRRAIELRERESRALSLLQEKRLK